MTIYVAAALVAAALVAMASGRVDPLLALLVTLILAGILGIAPAGQLIAGLSNPGVITVAAMLVIAKGIVQTGLVSRDLGAAGVDKYRAAGVPPALALEPRVLGLLAGSIGLGAIVVESGLAAVIADAISDLSSGTLGLVMMIMQPGGYTGAEFARFGSWILAPSLVTVCGVAYLLLSS